MFQCLVFCLLICLSCLCVTAYGQVCAGQDGRTGKCASNVYTCVFRNGYPRYFSPNQTRGDCTTDEFCCVALSTPNEANGSCSRSCGLPGHAQSKEDQATGSKINLDGSYDWSALTPTSSPPPQLLAQERSSRIVNGTDVEKYQLCWQGGVFVLDTNLLQNSSATATPIYIGGASLVANDMALTAAHVLQPFITDVNFIIFVAFGFRDIEQVTELLQQRNGSNMTTSTSWNDDEIPVFRVPNEMAFHSAYNDKTYENNIAIIRFDPLSCATPNICPICLSPNPANPYQPWKGQCFASGWGATANQSVSSTLQKLEMTIPYPLDCLRSFQHLGLKNYEIPSTMLCADSANREHPGGTCDRDGGSPLVCQTKYGNWELTGIVGVGVNRCRQVSAPTLFTNVGYYYDWIQSYTRGAYLPAASADTTPPSLPSTVSSTTRLIRTPSTPSTTLGQPNSTTTTTTTTLTTTVTTARHFQFSAPKVFLPKPAPPLTQKKKAAQAFFQERTDADDTAEDSSPGSLVNTLTVVDMTKSKKSSAGANNESSSGSLKLVLTGDGVVRRKSTTATPSTTSPVSTLSTTSARSTPTILTTNFPSSTTATTTTRRTSTSSTPTRSYPTNATLSTPSRRVVTFQQRRSDSTVAPFVFTTTRETDRTLVDALPTAIRQNNNKVVVFIRPSQDNPSILGLLRKRHKDSKLYTDSPSSSSTFRSVLMYPAAPRIPLAGNEFSNNTLRNVVTVAPATLAGSTIKSSSTTSTSNLATLKTPATVVISGVGLANLLTNLSNVAKGSSSSNETSTRGSTNLIGRPTGPSVMM